MLLRLSVICLFSILSMNSFAQGWGGKGELGYVLVEGNTESETLNMGLEFSKEQNNWAHKAKLAAIKASSDGVDSAESYLASWRSEYSFSERTYGFGDLRYFDDEFDSFEEIYTAAFGIGYKVIMEEDHSWDLSAGLGYRDTTDEVTQEDLSGVAYVLESDYKLGISESTEFENYTRVEITDDNTFSQNIASLSVSINSSLALKVKYEVRHNSDPAPDFRSVDRITSVNIVYTF